MLFYDGPKDDIVNFWSEVRASDLYDDGVITYRAPKKHFGRAFQRLTRDLGINTRPVKRNRAEIFCQFGNPGKGNAGVYRDSTNKNGKWQGHVVVKRGEWYTQSTVIHELGHALGLDHPADHGRTDTIMSYGAPGNLPWFTRLDRQVLTSLYG